MIALWKTTLEQMTELPNGVDSSHLDNWKALFLKHSRKITIHWQPAVPLPTQRVRVDGSESVMEPMTIMSIEISSHSSE